MKSNRFTGAKDFEDKHVIIDIETIVVDTVQGRCIELSEGGALVEYERKGSIVRDFFPWQQVRRMRYRESLCQDQDHALSTSSEEGRDDGEGGND